MPKRIKNPTKEEIYKDTIKNLKEIYLTGEKYAKAKNKVIDYDAIILLVNNIEKGLLSDSEIKLLTSFVFPLGVRRASDFSDYFKPFSEVLSNLKSQQSRLLGLCHTDLVRNQKINVVTSLKDYAELEKNFKENIIKL